MNGTIARLYEWLAAIYEERGDADQRVATLRNALRYREAYFREFPDAVPNPETAKLKDVPVQTMQRKVPAAYALAKAYISLGMHSPAESLAKEYRLCLE